MVVERDETFRFDPRVGHLQILLLHGHEHGDQLRIMLGVERDHAGDEGGEPLALVRDELGDFAARG